MLESCVVYECMFSVFQHIGARAELAVSSCAAMSLDGLIKTEYSVTRFCAARDGPYCDLSTVQDSAGNISSFPDR